MTYASLPTLPLKTLADTVRTLGSRLASAWAEGPVPCWTEYLRETRD
ncbi:MAG: hypothetical protein OEM24_01025 [Paracoccaceae bacterium]|nr:hypothetical protein [Paracoccaceae bacterium]